MIIAFHLINVITVLVIIFSFKSQNHCSLTLQCFSWWPRFPKDQELEKVQQSLYVQCIVGVLSCHLITDTVVPMIIFSKNIQNRCNVTVQCYFFTAESMTKLHTHFSVRVKYYYRIAKSLVVVIIFSKNWQNQCILTVHIVLPPKSMSKSVATWEHEREQQSLKFESTVQSSQLMAESMKRATITEL